MRLLGACPARGSQTRRAGRWQQVGTTVTARRLAVPPPRVTGAAHAGYVERVKGLEPSTFSLGSRLQAARWGGQERTGADIRGQERTSGRTGADKSGPGKWRQVGTGRLTLYLGEPEFVSAPYGPIGTSSAFDRVVLFGGGKPWSRPQAWMW